MRFRSSSSAGTSTSRSRRWYRIGFGKEHSWAYSDAEKDALLVKAKNKKK
jgi:hypothetical protein